MFGERDYAMDQHLFTGLKRMLTCGFPEHLQPKDTFLESEARLDVLDLELSAQGD